MKSRWGALQKGAPYFLPEKIGNYVILEFLYGELKK